MTALATYTLQQRKERWREFYDWDKPAQHLFVIEYSPDIKEKPLPSPDKFPERIEWAWRHYNWLVERMEWLRDDTIPYLHVHTGTETFAEAFGCKVHRPSDSQPFALPMIHDVAEISKIKVPKLESTPLCKLFDMADRLKEKAGKDAVLKMPDIQSPMDISALILEKSNFLMRLLDAPEAIKELAEKVRELQTEFLDAWFTRYGSNYVAHHPNYYMEKGVTLSEDEIGCVNPQMFEDYFLDELVDLSRRYGGIGIHCCADSKHQWENFKKVPGLKLLNLSQPYEVLKSAYEFFSTHTAQMHRYGGEGHPWTWPEQYPQGSRVVMIVEANSRDEAKECSEKLWLACGRD